MQRQNIYIDYKEKALIRKRDRYLSGPTAIMAAPKKSCWQKWQIPLVFLFNLANWTNAPAKAGVRPC